MGGRYIRRKVEKQLLGSEPSMWDVVEIEVRLGHYEVIITNSKDTRTAAGKGAAADS